MTLIMRMIRLDRVQGRSLPYSSESLTRLERGRMPMSCFVLRRICNNLKSSETARPRSNYANVFMNAPRVGIPFGLDSCVWERRLYDRS